MRSPYVKRLVRDNNDTKAAGKLAATTTYPPSRPLYACVLFKVYLKGFYEGIMQVGPCEGEKVCDAKPKIRQELMERGDALPYFEPESLVTSRWGGWENRILVVRFLKKNNGVFFRAVKIHGVVRYGNIRLYCLVMP